MSPLEWLALTVLWALSLWLGFFLLNHAEITSRLRAAVGPVLPKWLASLLRCPLCVAWWALVAFSLFTGFTPLLLWVPPVTLGMDLCYRRLAGPARTTEGEPK